MSGVLADGLFPGELPRGSLVAGYKIRQRVGGGSTGSVYAAVHPQTGRKVAVKLLHPHLAQPGEVLRRFEDQSQRVAALRHPGIVPLLEMGRLADGQVYLISEFALGQPLTDLLGGSGPLEVDSVRPLVEALALVLATAHGHDIIHGNLTPDNIWLTPRESGKWPPMVRVMDFGMGLLRGGQEGGRRWLEEIPYYVSPEQCRGEMPQAAADIYALGVITYQMLTGRLPFSSNMPNEVVRMHLMDEPRPPSGLVPLPAEFDGLLMTALAKDPSRRFSTMRQFLQTLRGEMPIDAPASPRAEQPPAPRPPSPQAPAPLAPQAPAPLAPPAPGPLLAPQPHLQPAVAAPLAPQPQVQPAVAAPPAPTVPPVAELETEPLPASKSNSGIIITPHPIPAARLPSASESAERSDRSSGVRNISTGVLPAQGAHRHLARLLSAALGLLLAAGAVLVGYQLLAGRFPWQSGGSHPEGQLLVMSQPGGAEVSVDNVVQPGRTPLTVRRLLRGQSYQLAVRLQGYEPWTQTVSLGLTEEEQRLSVKLRQASGGFGSITVTTSQRGDFFLDDREVATGVSEANLTNVPAGVPHELRVVAPGFKVLRQKVRVEAGRTQVLYFLLEPQVP